MTVASALMFVTGVSDIGVFSSEHPMQAGRKDEVGLRSAWCNDSGETG